MVLAFSGAIGTSCSDDDAETCIQRTDASVLLQSATGVQHATAMLSDNEVNDITEGADQRLQEQEQLPVSLIKSHNGLIANAPPAAAAAPGAHTPTVAAKAPVAAKSAVAAKASTAADAAKTAAAAKAKVPVPAKAAVGAKPPVAGRVLSPGVGTKPAAASKTAAASGWPVVHQSAAKAAVAKTLAVKPYVGEDPDHLFLSGGETSWDQVLGALIISFVLLVLATIAERASETARPIQAPSQSRAGARTVNIDVLKFLCMCGVTYYNQFMFSPSMKILVSSFFLPGFTFVAGMHSKDGGRRIMSAKSLRGCCSLLLGACLFNVMFSSIFGVLYADGFLKSFNMLPARASQIHLGTAPWAWYLLAIVMWRQIVTPLYNMLAHVGSGEMEAFCGTLSLCVLARYIMPEVCKQVGPSAIIYYRIIFFAPFFAIGLAVKDANLPTRLRSLSTILTALFLLSVTASSFTKPTDGLWFEMAHYIAQTTGHYPLAVKHEFLMDIIVQISMSLSVVVSILEGLRLCYSYLVALGPCIETVATWGSRSLTAYMLNYIFVLFASSQGHNDFALGGWAMAEILRVASAVLVTMFFCSGPVDKIFGPLLRPEWLLDIILMPIQGNAALKSSSDTYAVKTIDTRQGKSIGGDPYEVAYYSRIVL